LEASTTLTRHSAGGQANCLLSLECDVIAAGALDELLLTGDTLYNTAAFPFNHGAWLEM